MKRDHGESWEIVAPARDSRFPHPRTEFHVTRATCDNLWKPRLSKKKEFQKHFLNTEHFKFLSHTTNTNKKKQMLRWLTNRNQLVMNKLHRLMPEVPGVRVCVHFDFPESLLRSVTNKWDAALSVTWYLQTINTKVATSISSSTETPEPRCKGKKIK